MENNKEFVIWIDSGFSLRSDIWQTKEEIKELLNESKVVETLGFNIYEDEDWLVLAQSINKTEESLIRGGYFIYKPCIRYRQKVEVQ